MANKYKSQFQNCFKRVPSKLCFGLITLLSFSAPTVALSATPATPSQAPPNDCITALDVKVCTKLQTYGYGLTSQLGTQTSPTFLLKPEDKCPVFGAMNTPKGDVRVEACFVSNSLIPKLQGVVRISKAGAVQQQAFIWSLPRGYFLSDDTHLGVKGYEFYLDDVRVAPPQKATLQEAIAHLEAAKKTYPNRKVDGYYDGQKIGYELFWNGVRVGYEPSWNRQQAIDNLQFNKKMNPDTRVAGTLNGEKIGYELFWNGLRVGFEPGWTQQQANSNLQWNQQSYRDTTVIGLFNGY
jgi:hypothetical protein